LKASKQGLIVVAKLHLKRFVVIFIVRKEVMPRIEGDFGNPIKRIS
jgi:hypothetical protein